MSSIRRLQSKGTLFLDFRYQGQRMREYTTLPDTAENRKRLIKVLARIEADIAAGTFNYEATFGKQVRTTSDKPVSPSKPNSPTQTFEAFAKTWFEQTEITWRKSYRLTQRGVIDKYLLPYFGEKEVGSITKSDVLEFRASLAKVPGRNKDSSITNRRINAIMKPLRQILNEAADRFEFTTAFRNIKPLRVKRTDVQPFSLEEVQRILQTVRADFRNYYIVRFFTGMRTGEVHGLKWKYVDFEKRLILVRESIVLNEEDELKTDGSSRDIQMNQLVFDALKDQRLKSKEEDTYVFINREHKPLDNKNVINRVWNPLLRHLGLEIRRPYQMRHTAATLWLASGEAPEWIARQLGHTSTEMLFRVYSRYIPNLTRKDGSAMDRLVQQQMDLESIRNAGQAKRLIPGSWHEDATA